VRGGASRGASGRDKETAADQERFFRPTAERFSRVLSMFDSQGVQVPYTT